MLLCTNTSSLTNARLNGLFIKIYFSKKKCFSGLCWESCLDIWLRGTSPRLVLARKKAYAKPLYTSTPIYAVVNTFLYRKHPFFCKVYHISPHCVKM